MIKKTTEHLHERVAREREEKFKQEFQKQFLVARDNLWEQLKADLKLNEKL